MKNIPKVSIIIPTYNRAKYLPQAIESALAQDYPNLEVIVSDNCSIDETPEVVKKYLNDKRFKYFRNKENIGMVRNWRKAIFEYSTGEWGLILSDDDFLIDNTYISKAMHLIENHSNVVIVHANMIIYEEENNEVFLDRHFSKIMDGKDVFLNYWENELSFLFCTTIFNLKVAKSLNCFAFDKVIGSDTLEFLRLSLRGNVAFIKDRVAVYRIHSESISRTSNLDILIENSKFITVPYREAKKLNIFSEEVLEKWKLKMLRKYFNSVLGKVLDKNDTKLLQTFFYRIKNEFPEVLPIFFYPKNILKLLTFKFPPLYKWLKEVRRNFRNRIR